MASILLLAHSTAGAEKPNIVLILADDLGWADTTLYGHTTLYETPNLQRLAARGMTFTQAYAAHPLCSPTRSSILTGQNPARSGFVAPAGHIPEVRYSALPKLHGPVDQPSTTLLSTTRMDPSKPTLAKLLKEAGYSTAHFGKWHLGKAPHSPLEFGFDVDIPHWNGSGPGRTYLAPWSIPGLDGEPGEHIEDRMAEEAVNWLKNRDKEKPFFLNYWQFCVHAPFGAKPDLIERYRQKIDLDSEQRSPTYAAMVHSLDDAVGTLLDALDAEGIADDTVIVFYSDNGGNVHCGLEETTADRQNYTTAITSNAPLRGGKGNINEGGIRVPAVVVWPDHAVAGSTSETRIQSTDLYPTLLGIAGVSAPVDHPIDGYDFSAALKGSQLERAAMFTYVPSYGNTPGWLPPSMAVHHGKWKLIRTFHHGTDGADEYRLFDLSQDIGEQHNLAADHPDHVQRLDSLIDAYIAEANVIIPAANPKFDASQYDPSKIGIQEGGFKMPPAPKSDPQPVTTFKDPLLKDWLVKNGKVSIEDGILSIGYTTRPAYLANAKTNTTAPTQLKLRTRGQGTGNIQWRLDGQTDFPTDQSQSYQVKSSDWQEITIPITSEGRVMQIRIFPPISKSHPTAELDWIDIGSHITDFAEK